MSVIDGLKLHTDFTNPCWCPPAQDGKADDAVVASQPLKMKREILFVLLAAYSASAVTDLRPQTEADGPAKTEADPKLNVHIVFSNHLVRFNTSITTAQSSTRLSCRHILPLSLRNTSPC